MTTSGLKKRDLPIIAATNKGNYSIEIHMNSDSIWQAVLKIGNTATVYDILTIRDDVKTWKYLEDAIKYFKETCPDCHDVKVNVGEWSFVKVNPDE